MKKLIAFMLAMALSVSNGISFSFAEDSDKAVSEKSQSMDTEENSEQVDLAADKILAFPGAEGAGKYATGGRGGKVVHVTNLNDKGAGSFREAVGGSNRIVVFDVGGTIELESNVVVGSNITIAGQTAPGGKGITLKNFKLGMGGDNAIIRYISSRPGPGPSSASNTDAWGGAKGSNSIIDHCSLGFATDENWGLYSNNMNYTVQYTIVGPANCWGGHAKGVHGFGIMFGKGQASWHHNLIAHSLSRNFRGKVVDQNVMDYVNNVLYDWGNQTAYGTFGHVNYANNYFKAGPSTSGAYRYFVFSSGSKVENYKFYLTGNKIVNADKTVRNSEDKNWEAVSFGSVDASTGKGFTAGTLDKYNPQRLPNEQYYRTDTYMPLKVNGEDLSVVPTMESADAAFDHVTKYAGAGVNPECKPAIDLEVCADAINGTGNLTGTEDVTKGANENEAKIIEQNKITQTSYDKYYPEPVLQKDIVDNDKDGMDDNWELARGLDPSDPSDALGDFRGDGYNNIEYYINDLTVNSFPEGVVTPSQPIVSSILVDPSADEVSGESYKTISKAVEYVNNNGQAFKGKKTIYVTPGSYDEEISIISDDFNIMPKKDATGDVIVKGVKLSADAVNTSITGIKIDGKVEISGDKAIFTDCGITFDGVAVDIKNKARAYFKNCTINGTVSGDAQAIFNYCTLSARDVIAKSTYADTSAKYGLLIMNSTIDGKETAILGKSDGTKGQIVYYNNKITNINSARFDDVTGKTEDIKFRECKTLNADGTEADLSNAPKYEQVITEPKFLDTYSPYKHIKGNDKWNPGSFDELTPSERMKEIADSVNVPSGMISEDTELVHEYSGDSNIKMTWTSSDTSCFKNNTIVVGEYGSGVKYAVLTLTVSREGYNDVVKKFNIIVGSAKEDYGNIIDFEKHEVGADTKTLELKVEDETATPKNENIDWGITDNINDVEAENHGKIFYVKQSKSTDPTMYDFLYRFGEKSERVVEADFDIYIGALSADSQKRNDTLEVYLRGNLGIGQLRFSGNNSISYYENGSNAGNIATNVDFSKWYRIKMVVSTVGITNKILPKVDYYIYDESGKEIGKKLNAAPSGKVADMKSYDDFITNRFVFRPNRKSPNCEFYVDNILYKDLTEIAEEDAADLEESYVMENGSRLPAYGNQLSEINWRVVEGQSDLVNADGTINYDKCGNTAVIVRGTVSYGENLKASVETGDIAVVIKGTGQNTEIVSDKYFNDTEDFSGWFKQKGATSEDNINLDNNAVLGGNDTKKIEIGNKAVFKKFNNPASSGKLTFTTDLFSGADAVETGRTFRIFFENESTSDDGNGLGSADFGSNNIFYQLTNIGGKAIVVTSDTPKADNTGNNPYEGQEIGTLDLKKWYRVQVDIDFTDKKAITKIYQHGTDGSYSPDNISGTPIGSVETELIAKTPLQFKQIRLVRTAAGPMYFDNISVSAERNVTGISIVPSNIRIKSGETYQLNAVVSPSDALNKNITWSSNNPNVATVSDEGLVSASGNGEAIIKAETEDGGFSSECKVVVSDSVENVTVTVSPKTAEIEKGKTQQLNAVVLPEDASNKNITWTSSDINIAVVDENGLVTAKGVGTAIIKAEVEGGNHAECEVTVKEIGAPVFDMGDVDKEKGVTVNDASVTLDYVLKKKSADGISEGGIDRMDVNGDNVVTAEDASEILQKALKHGEFDFVNNNKTTVE